MVSGIGTRRTAKKPVLPLLVLILLLGLAAIAQNMYFPQLTKTQKKGNGTVVDVGNASQGYIQVQHKKSSKRLKLRISHGDQTYTYDLNQKGEFEVFPLQMGSGKYKVNVFEQVKGSKYSSVSSFSFNADIQDSMLAFLYPNQYVCYDENSSLIAQAQEICSGLNGDKEKAEAVRSFVTRKFMYDYMKALTVNNMTTYLPDLEQVLSAKQGICFDLASMVCAMLRMQGIPTKLVVGYADQSYHAWNQVYVDGEWMLIDTTATITGTSVKRYQPEREY